MWVYFQGGFVSIVQQRNTNALVVRGRKRGDVEAFVEAAGLEDNIERTVQSDYRYRTVMTRQQVAYAMAAVVQAINYSNFKDHVHRQQGPDRARIYGNVWAATLAVEESKHRE